MSSEILKKLKSKIAEDIQRRPKTVGARRPRVDKTVSMTVVPSPAEPVKAAIPPSVSSVFEQIQAACFLGIAKGLSHEEHIAALGYLSSSGLGPLLRSPAHYHAYLARERKSTKAQNIGTAGHSIILEKAIDRIAVAPSPEDYPNALKTGDELKARCKQLDLPVSGTKAELVARIREKDSGLVLWEDILAKFSAETEGKTIVTKDEYDDVVGMAKAVHAHPEASLALAGGVAETSIFWDQNGVKCKARLDYIKVATRELIDLKTTEDASPYEFSRSVFNFGYFRQAAVYIAGVEAVYGFRPTFKIIAVEKKAPYGVSVFKLTDAALARGREEFERGIKIYSECSDIGEWPAYHSGVQQLDLPSWAW